MMTIKMYRVFMAAEAIFSEVVAAYWYVIPRNQYVSDVLS